MDRLISLSSPLIENSKYFLNIEKTTFLKSLKYIFSKVTFVGWGRKKSGLWATQMAKLTRGDFLLLEDGLIRSLGLGVEGSPSFSMVQDNVGIYYDATTPSKLENILNSYDFNHDKELMQIAKEAREKIIEYKISKYNNFKKVDLSYLNNKRAKVLIIAQTYGDSSLKYGLAENFTTKEIIEDAIRDNPHVEVYIKIHPDVLLGKKKSDIDLEQIPKTCHILTDNANPLVLLKYFNKVYTKTSGMGFEALLLNREVHCYGMPFYAGWGVTIDKLKAPRRQRMLTVNEIFASMYILYTTYYNPYTHKKIDLLETIESIVSHQNKHNF
ncbi:MAG TPA: capsule polysaccharide transporter [Campylobacterales bacterium]|nr:capsule polysaccharide transporter [Campylobacterales bacterium]HIP41294.1 capsule polysaccharide transporter [Campylobacterales bacterium]